MLGVYNTAHHSSNVMSIFCKTVTIYTMETYVVHSSTLNLVQSSGLTCASEVCSLTSLRVLQSPITITTDIERAVEELAYAKGTYIC